MSRYLVGILFCLVIALAYPAFRDEAFQDLRHRKIRKRDIRQKQKGALNFWFYTELEKEYGLGRYGILLRLYPIVAGMFTVLHISLGWMEALAAVDLILSGLPALYLSAITLYACIRRNRRLFGQAFLLLAWRESTDTVPKDKILEPKSKNGHYIHYYSSVFDLILTLSPLVFPVLMGILEGRGW